MSNICVLVMGGPRAGTSLCAGILHRLGVHMGDDIGEPNEWNQLGFYEDGEFADIYGRMCFGDGQGSMNNFMPVAAKLEGALLTRHTDAIKRRCNRMWGVKSSRLCYVLADFVAACLIPIKVIRMVRQESEMIASWRTRAGVSVAEATATIRNAVSATEKSLAACKPELLEVEYTTLLTHSARQVPRIAGFLGLPTNDEAESFIDPSMRRFLHE